MSKDKVLAPKSVSVNDIEIQVAVNTYLDGVYGEQFPEKSKNEYTGSYRRKGEGKFFKKILRYHEKQAKRYAQKLEFEPNAIYVFAIKHHRENEAFGTLSAFNWWLNSFRLFFSSGMTSEIHTYVETIVESMKVREIYTPIYLVTNVDDNFDDFPMINRVYAY